MLWKKAWKECRCRVWLCFTLTFACLATVWLPVADRLGIPVTHLDAAGLGKLWRAYSILFGAACVPIGALILAGSGINTQTAWGMAAGFHPSTYFLLGLPVSRRQLLRVRAVLGWLLTMAWATASLLVFAAVAICFGGQPPWETWIGQLLHLLIIASMTYTLAVWTSSFLDELFSGTLSLGVTSLFLGYALGGGPGWPNLLLYVDSQAILTGGRSAWLQTAFYLAISATFYLLAQRVVERKEY